ncbi:unnamed protein product [Ambrosiozyma monospora]|uniref:Unnamed protein product n=1 Tax=Ambrosiozyma monospora TaxID=43982 RepID=A0ACB5U680_AMBMO|nr:unnamed protein product [Ambrosiozyma monospora]
MVNLQSTFSMSSGLTEAFLVSVDVFVPVGVSVFFSVLFSVFFELVSSIGLLLACLVLKRLIYTVSNKNTDNTITKPKGNVTYASGFLQSWPPSVNPKMINNKPDTNRITPP